jgi:predicted TIM-barrel fold metal-dependent hydrolase
VADGRPAVIDADTHLTEPHDLWTSRAPAALADRVPQVREVDGRDRWIFDGVVLGNASAGGVVRRDGTKALGAEFMQWSFGDGHAAASDPAARLALMDEMGVDVQVVYPNVAGFGGQRLAKAGDGRLRRVCVEIWNDAMAEMQERSGGRLLPMALVPWWDPVATATEIARAKGLGLRGVILHADPQELDGGHDLGHPSWDPVWAACAELGLPASFHIGASDTQHSWFGTSPWPSHDDDQRLALGSAMIYLGNARIIGNLIFSGVLERHPGLKVVSVESGIGWIPFTLEALDYQLHETSPTTLERLSMAPSAYFRRQIYGCFWFERTGLPELIRSVGVDNCLFETDFPHPTCLYPDGVRRALSALDGLDQGEVAKVMGQNAARLYAVTLPVVAA